MSVTVPILGIDPGKKTGYSLWTPGGDGEVEVQELVYGDRNDDRLLEETIQNFTPVVVGEKFVINAATVKNTQAPWSLKLLGVCEFLASKYQTRYVEQSQSAAKRFATNDRLKALGWYVPGKGHGNDATRQTLLYLVSNGWWSSALD